MKIRAAYRHFNFPYLYDGDTQATANAYGPKATPHVFIFDAERKLRFEGRMDNSQRESLVKTQDTRNAIDALLAGQPVPWRIPASSAAPPSGSRRRPAGWRISRRLKLSR